MSRPALAILAFAVSGFALWATLVLSEPQPIPMPWSKPLPGVTSECLDLTEGRIVPTGPMPEAPAGEAVPFTTLIHTEDFGGGPRLAYVITEVGPQAIHAGLGRTEAPIDFDRQMAIAVHAGMMPQTGYGIEIKAVIETADAIVVMVEETTTTGANGNAITHPMHLIRLRGSSKPVQIRMAGRALPVVRDDG